MERSVRLFRRPENSWETVWRRHRAYAGLPAAAIHPNGCGFTSGGANHAGNAARRSKRRSRATRRGPRSGVRNASPSNREFAGELRVVFEKGLLALQVGRRRLDDAVDVGGTRDESMFAGRGISPVISEKLP